MFSTPEATRRSGARAWLQAMLNFEAGLVTAQAAAGLVPGPAAANIARCCRAELFDAESVAERAAASATPVIPLVRDLTELVEPDSRPHVHRGATSQDVLDTAAMLVCRDVVGGALADLRAAADECARLVGEHRSTPMIARSLLQQALPTTFGARAATWLTALDSSIVGLHRVHGQRLAVQLGGPAGTLSALGSDGPRVVRLLAAELGLAEPVVPWHTDRTRIAELAGTLGTAAGATGKIARDVTLHAQTEVGELTEGHSGGSSAMPHKQNPVGSVLITAASERVPGLVSTLLGAGRQEYERGAGTWQAEWEPVGELLRLVASAAARTRELLAGLRVHPERMTENLGLTRGLVMAESAAAPLIAELGRTAGQDLVAELCRRAVEQGSSLRAELLADSRVREVVSAEDIHRATEPAEHLGSAAEFADRARTAHAEEEQA